MFRIRFQCGATVGQLPDDPTPTASARRKDGAARYAVADTDTEIERPKMPDGTPTAVTPLSGMSSEQLSDLHRMAENMQRAARQGLITSRAHARWKIAARGLCFLVRAEFDSRTLASLGEQA